MAIQNPQIPLFGRIGSGGLQPTLNGGTLVLSDFDYTMQFPDWTAHVLIVTSSVALTATRRIIAPLGGAPPTGLGFHEFLVHNGTSGNQGVTIVGATGTGVTIPNGQTMMVVSDGVNYYAAGTTEERTVTTISRPNQNAAIPSTALLTGGSTTAGVYRAAFYYVTRTAGSGTVQLVLTWNDGIQVQTEAVKPLESQIGYALEDQVVIRMIASQNINFYTTYTASGLVYDLFIALEKLF